RDEGARESGNSSSRGAAMNGARETATVAEAVYSISTTGTATGITGSTGSTGVIAAGCCCTGAGKDCVGATGPGAACRAGATVGAGAGAGAAGAAGAEAVAPAGSLST